jgi:hypothetical protein
VISRLVELSCGGPSRGAVDEALAGLAEEHGLAPRLGSLVAAGALAVTGEHVRARLTRAHRECAARNLVAEAIVAPLVDAIGAGRAVYLKGAALIRSLYRDPGARAMSDVDVLVDDLERAIATGERLGGKIFWPADRPVLRRFTHELVIILDGRVSVDVHGSIAAWPLFSAGATRAIFRRATAARTPSPADLFVTLAINAAQDGFVVPARAIVDGVLLGRAVDPATVRRAAVELTATRATEQWIAILARHGLGGWSPRGRARWTPRAERSWTRGELLRARLGLARATGWRRYGAFAAARASLHVADKVVVSLSA